MSRQQKWPIPWKPSMAAAQMKAFFLIFEVRKPICFWACQLLPLSGNPWNYTHGPDHRRLSHVVPYKKSWGKTEPSLCKELSKAEESTAQFTTSTLFLHSNNASCVLWAKTTATTSLLNVNGCMERSCYKPWRSVVGLQMVYSLTVLQAVDFRVEKRPLESVQKRKSYVPYSYKYHRPKLWGPSAGKWSRHSV